MSLVLGHRGASAYAPDNTAASFNMAIDMGADGVETDVHLTKDGVPVIQHNYRIDRNSNGHGYVDELTYEELRQFDFGSWKGEQFKGEKIMTLDEFLDLADKRMRFVNVELKEPRKKPSDLAKKTVEAIVAHKMLDRVLLSSFDHEMLKQAQQLCPEMLTGALYDEDEVDQKNINEILEDAPKYVAELGCDFANPDAMYAVEDGLVERFAEKGIGVAVWTVDKPYVAKILARQGIKCIITNKPDIISKAVAEECSKK